MSSQSTIPMERALAEGHRDTVQRQMGPVQEVLNRVRSRGYTSVSSFFAAHPGEPYGKLLKLIAEPVEGTNYFDLPILALEHAHLQEAVRLGTIRDFAKDTLVRSLRDHLRSGWKRGKNWTEMRAQAYADWPTPDDADDRYGKVWKALKQLEPPVGWRPEPKDDPLINQAFDIGWPLEERGGEA